MQDRRRKEQTASKPVRSRIRAVTLPDLDEKPLDMAVDFTPAPAPRVLRVPSSTPSTSAPRLRLAASKRKKKRVWVPILPDGLPGLPKRGR
jgi:hypothetical protein